MSKIQIGIIGTGGMGNHHARELLRRSDVRVTAVCDTSEASLDRLAETVGTASARLNRYDNVDALLACEPLNAVVIATPHTDHADQVRACLQNGLHVLWRPLSAAFL